MHYPSGVAAAAGAASPVQVEHTLVAADLQGQTVGYLDKAGGPGGGTFVPRQSAGVDIIRMTLGGGVPTFNFGMLGSFFPDTDATWRQIRITGTFEAGTFTITFVRSAASGYIADNVDETLWGFGPLSDRMIIGNTYSCFIDDRLN